MAGLKAAYNPPFHVLILIVRGATAQLVVLYFAKSDREAVAKPIAKALLSSRLYKFNRFLPI